MSHLTFLGLQGFARRRIAVAVGLALSAAAANAQAATEEAKTLPKVSVAAAEPEETPKVDRVSSPKFTQDLIDTPQTIAVVSQQVLQQQGATTLSQALRNTPGVTFLLGENGNTATGDSIFMRGFDTQGSHLHRRHPRPRQRHARHLQHRAGGNRQGSGGSGLRSRRRVGLRESGEQGAHRRKLHRAAAPATAPPTTAASPATSTTSSATAAPRCASTSWARTATSMDATSSSARAGQSRPRWRSASRARRAPTSIYCTPSRTTYPTVA